MEKVTLVYANLLATKNNSVVSPNLIKVGRSILNFPPLRNVFDKFNPLFNCFDTKASVFNHIKRFNEARHILIQTFNSNPIQSIGHAHNQKSVMQQKTN